MSTPQSRDKRRKKAAAGKTGAVAASRWMFIPAGRLWSLVLATLLLSGHEAIRAQTQDDAPNDAQDDDATRKQDDAQQLAADTEHHLAADAAQTSPTDTVSVAAQGALPADMALNDAGGLRESVSPELIGRLVDGDLEEKSVQNWLQRWLMQGDGAEGAQTQAEGRERPELHASNAALPATPSAVNGANAAGQGAGAGRSAASAAQPEQGFRDLFNDEIRHFGGEPLGEFPVAQAPAPAPAAAGGDFSGVLLGLLGLAGAGAAGGGGSAAAAAAVTIAKAAGAVVKGYLVGAVVWRDGNNNNRFDGTWNDANSDGMAQASEITGAGSDSFAITDASGNYADLGGSGAIHVFGGKDLYGTGLAFRGVLDAPDTATVITPLTTLVQSLRTRDVNGNVTGSVDDAANRLITLLGSPAGVDRTALLTVDPIAGIGGSNSATALTLYKQAAQVANLLVAASAAAQKELVDGGRADTIATRTEAAGLAVASIRSALLDAVASNSTINLSATDGSSFAASVFTKLTAQVGTLDVSVADLASAVGTVNASFDQLAGASGTAASALRRLVATEYVIQNDLSTALTTTGGFSSANYTEASVVAKLEEVASVVGSSVAPTSSQRAATARPYIDTDVSATTTAIPVRQIDRSDLQVIVRLGTSGAVAGDTLVLSLEGQQVGTVSLGATEIAAGQVTVSVPASGLANFTEGQALLLTSQVRTAAGANGITSLGLPLVLDTTAVNPGVALSSTDSNIAGDRVTSTPPEVSFTGLEVGATLNVRIQKPDGSSVTYRKTDTGSSERISLATLLGVSAAPEGAYTVYASQVDRWGHDAKVIANGSETTLTLTYDATPPSITLGASSVSLSATAAAQFSQTLTVSGANGAPTLSIVQAAGSGVQLSYDANTNRLTGDFSSVADGLYTLRVAASDLAGNQAVTREMQVYVDRIAPTVATRSDAGNLVISAAAASSFDRALVTIASAAASEAPIDTTTADVYAASDVARATSLGVLSYSTGTGRFSGNLGNTNVFPDGDYVIVVHVRDKAGNTTDQAVGLTIDRQPPTLHLDAVATDGIINASEASAGLVLRGDATGAPDGQPVTLTFYAAADTSRTTALGTLTGSVSSGRFAASLPSGATLANGFRLADGASYQLVGSVADLAGNTATDRGTLSVDISPPPVPVLTAPVDSGALSNDRVTKNSSFTVDATTAASTWQYTTDAGANWTTVTNGNSFSVGTSGQSVSYSASQIGVRVVDAAGNTSSAYHPTSLQVDQAAPAVSAVTAPLSATYALGQEVSFVIQGSEPMYVDYASGGTPPRIRVTLDSGAIRYATYASGSGTSSLTFKYTVQSGDLDTNGLALGTSIALPSTGGVASTITDAAGNALNLTLNNVADLSGLKVDGSLQGSAVDGYLVDVLIFVDTNNNNAPDQGEGVGGSVGAGAFSIPGGSGHLIMRGGQDISTGHDFTVQYEAPEGYRVINPVSTLVARVQSLGGVSYYTYQNINDDNFDPADPAYRAAATQSTPGAMTDFARSTALAEGIVTQAGLLAGRSLPTGASLSSFEAFREAARAVGDYSSVATARSAKLTAIQYQKVAAMMSVVSSLGSEVFNALDSTIDTNKASIAIVDAIARAITTGTTTSSTLNTLLTTQSSLKSVLDGAATSLGLSAAQRAGDDKVAELIAKANAIILNRSVSTIDGQGNDAADAVVVLGKMVAVQQVVTSDTVVASITNYATAAVTGGGVTSEITALLGTSNAGLQYLADNAPIGPLLPSRFTVTSDATVPSGSSFATVNEGRADGGDNSITFTITRAGGLDGTVVLRYELSGSTTLTADRFVGGRVPSGQVTFGPSETVKTVTLTFANNTARNPNEVINLKVSDVYGYSQFSDTSGNLLATGGATFMLRDDDPNTPVLSGTGTLQVAAATASAAPVTVDYFDSTATLNVTVTATGGRVSRDGVTFASTDTFSGTLAQINTQLAQLQYSGTSGSTSGGYTVAVTPSGRSGVVGSYAAPVVIHNPSTVSVTAATSVVAATPTALLQSISVADVDSSTVSVRVTSGNGALTLQSGTGVFVSSVSGGLVVEGTPEAVTRALQGLLFQANAGITAASLQLSVSDGDGLTVDPTRTLNVAVTPAAPVLAAPSQFVATKGQPLALDGFSLSDADSSSLTVTVSASVGTLSLARLDPSVSLRAQTSSSITLTGSPAQLAQQLASVNYSAPMTTATSATLSLSVNDGGTPVTRSIPVAITGNPPPAAGGNLTADVPVLEDTLTTLTLRPTSTADDGGPVQQVRILSVTGGTLTAADGTAVTLGEAGRRLDLVDGAVSLKFTPSADSTATASIRYVLVDPVDATLNSAASTLTVPITAVNDAPVLTLSPVASNFIENAAAPMALLPSFLLSDVDSARLSSATIRITSGFVQGDLLQVNGAQGLLTPDANGRQVATLQGLTASYNTNTGVLTLTGDQSIDVYRAVLAGLSYTRSAATMDALESGSRALEVTVTDTDGALATQARTFTVQGVNDAPVITPATQTLSFAESVTANKLAASTSIGAGITLSDADGASTLTGATASFSSGYRAGDDVISLNTSSDAVRTALSGLTTSFDVATGTFRITGSASLATYQTVMSALTYQNASSAPVVGARQIQIGVTDAGGLSGAQAVTLTLNVGGLYDDAAVLDLNGTSTTGTGNSAVSIGGLKPVSAVLAPQGSLTDVDSATAASLKFTLTQPAQPNGVTVTDIGTLSLNSAGQTAAAAAGLQAVWNATTRELTVSSTSGTPRALTAYESVLRGVIFSSADTAGVRTVTITADVGSSPVSAQVDLSLANSPFAAVNGSVLELVGSAGSSLVSADLGASMVATGTGRLSVSNLFRAVDIDASLVSAGTSVTLTGSSSANVITGSVGNDVIAGGGGTDVLIGGDGADTFRLTLDQIQNASTGVLRVFGGKATLSNGSYSAGDDASPLDVIELQGTGGTLAAADWAKFSGIEQVKVVGTDAFTLYGSANGQTLVGGSGADTLVGGGGADVLTGGAGADTFVFADADTGSAATVTAGTLGYDEITDITVGDRIILGGAALGAASGLTWRGEQSANPGNATKDAWYDRAAGMIRFEDASGAVRSIKVPASVSTGSWVASTEATGSFAGGLALTLMPGKPGTPALTAASDTGLSAGDGITSLVTPAFTVDVSACGAAADNIILLYAQSGSGTRQLVGAKALTAADVTAGSVQIRVGDTATGVTLQASTLANGSLTVSAVQQVGSLSSDYAVATSALVIDTAAPGVPTVSLDAASDTGFSPSDAITSNATPGVLVRFTPADLATGGRVSIALGNQVVASRELTAGERSAGQAVVTVSTLGVDGTKSLAVTLTDAAGNAASAVSTSLVLDTAAPSTPSSLALSASSDSGFVGDNITSVIAPVVRVAFTAAEVSANATLRLFVNGSGTAAASRTLTATDISNGYADLTVSGGLGSDGAKSLRATVTDVAGNASALSSARSLVLDTAAPLAPTVTLLAASDSGIRGDSITSVTTPTVRVAFDATQVSAGASVTLTSGASTVGTATLLGSNVTAGFVDVALSSLGADGAKSIQATVADVAGNTSAAGSLALTLDTTAPAAPTAIALRPLSDSGVQGDNATRTTAPTVRVSFDRTQVSANATLTVTSSGTTVGTATLTSGDISNGYADVALADLGSDGVKSLRAALTDVAANAGTASAALALTIDTTGPSAPVVTLLPASNSGSRFDTITNVSQPTVQVRFTSAEVAAGATVTVKNGDATVGTVTLTDAQVTAGTVDVPLTTALGADGSKTLSVALTDPSGNPGAAGSLSLTLDTTAPTAPTLTLRPASDSGLRSDDLLTQVATPTVRVAFDRTQVSTGSGVAITSGGSSVGTATLSAQNLLDGYVDVTVSSLGADGSKTLLATVTDIAANTSSSGSLTLNLDRTAPTAPTVTLTDGSNSGSTADTLTNVATPTVRVAFTGTEVSAGGTVTVSSGGNTVGTATLAAADISAGFVNVALSSLGTDGAKTISAALTDAAGNAGPAGTLSITLDKTAPSTPTLALTTASDSGVQGDNQTRITAPTVRVAFNSADVAVGAAVAVTSGAATVGTASLSAAHLSAGFVDIALSSLGSDGVKALSASLTDLAANTSSSGSLSIKLDTTGPSAPLVTLLPASDTGIKGDNRTSATTPTVRVAFTASQVEAGATVAVTLAGVQVGTATLTAGDVSNGYVDVRLANLGGDGTKVFSALLTDQVGNPGTAGTLSIVLDTTAPAIPTLLALDAADDTGRLGTDGITRNTTGLTITGRADAGTEVTLYVDGSDTAAATVTAGSDGRFSADLALAEGSHTVAAASMNAQGNASVASAPLALVIDTTAPGAPGLTLTAASDSGMAGDGLTRVVTPTVRVSFDRSQVSAGAAVAVTSGASTVGSANLSAGNITDGYVDIALANLGSDGPKTLKATLTDLAGNLSAASADLALTLDTTPPTAPTLTLRPGSDSGLGPDDLLTQVDTPIIRVAFDRTQVPLNSTVAITAGGNSVGTATLSEQNRLDGYVDVTVSSLGADGSKTLLATLTDTAANPSASGSLTLNLDRTAPTAPTVTLTEASNSGSTSDTLTNVDTPTVRVAFTGAQVSAGGTIRVTSSGTTVGTANLQASDISAGFVNVALTTLGADGAKALAATVTDAAGNTSAAGNLSITLDKATPTAPTVSLLDSSNSGSLLDTLTNVVTPTVRVSFNGAQVADGGTVLVRSGATVVGTATLLASDATRGYVDVTLSSLSPDGAKTLSATVTDLAANTSNPSANLLVTLDATAPSLPTLALADVSDTGVTGDNRTNQATPTVRVTFNTAQVDAGSSVTVFSGANAVGTVALNSAQLAAGFADVTVSSLGADGSKTLTAKVTDAAANASAASASLVLAVDAAAPTVTAATAATSLLAGGSTQLTFSFNEAVTGFAVDDLQLTGGSVGSLSTTDGGRTYTTLFTPNATDALAASVSIKPGSYTDIAGNLGAASNTLSLSGDTLAPSIKSVTATPGANRQAVTMTIEFSEAVSNFGFDDLRFSTPVTGTLTPVSGSGGTRYTLQALATDPTANTLVVSINAGGLADASGNLNPLLTLPTHTFNNKPVVSGYTPGAVLATDELTNAAAQALGPLTGTLVVAEQDVGNVLTATASAPVVTLDGVTLTSLDPALSTALASGLRFSGPVTSVGGSTATSIGWTFAPTGSTGQPFTYNFDFLREGQVLSVSYSVPVFDGYEYAVNPGLITFSILGKNDVAVIGSPLVTSFTEDLSVGGDGLLRTSGVLSLVDLDAGEGSFSTTVSTVGSALGSLTLAANGAYSYAVANSALQYLGAGASRVDSFLVRSLDGTSKTVTFTLNGVNDTPVIGGGASGAVTEETSLVSTGLLTSVDADALQSNVFTAVSGTTSRGSYSVGSNGQWSFSLNNGNAQVQALGLGQTLVDTFVATSVDGSASQTVSITINGTNDTPLIGGSATGAVTEDVTLTTTGKLTSVDVDANQSNVFQAVAAGTTARGSYSVGSDGQWSFSLSNSNTQVQTLGVGQTLIDSFVVTSGDGSASQTVSITINGTNDAPVLTLGAASNGVEEDAGGSYATLATSKRDIDNLDVASYVYGNNGWKLSTDGLTISRIGNFGTATLNISSGNVTYGGVLLTPGKVVYQLNDALTETNALSAGQSDTDSFLLTVTDRNGATHTQQMTFDVTGADDGASGWTSATPTANLYLLDNPSLGYSRVAVRVGASGLDVDSGVTYLGQIRTAAGAVVGSVELVASGGALHGSVAKGSMAVGTSYTITVADNRSSGALSSISVTGVALSALTDVSPTQASGYQLATGSASNEETAGSQFTTYNAAIDSVVPATFLGNSGNDFFADLRTGEAFAGGAGLDSALIASSRVAYTDRLSDLRQLPAYSVAMLDAAAVRKYAETTQYGSDVLPGNISTEFSQAVAGTSVPSTQAVAVAVGYTDQTALTHLAFTDAEQLIFTSTTNTVDRVFTLGQDSDARLQLKLSDLGDRLIAGSGLTDNVDGGLGNDVVFGNGGGTSTLAEVIRGGEGDDVLAGGQPNVVGGYAKLFGGQGDDVLVAMGGVVEATGGTGRDVFALWDNTSSVQMFIKDFNASVDKLDLSALSSALTAVNAQTQTTGLQQLQQSIATFYAQQPAGVLQLDLSDWLTPAAKAGGATALVSIELEQSGGAAAGGQFSVDNITLAATAWSPSLWKEDLSLLVQHG